MRAWSKCRSTPAAATIVPIRHVLSCWIKGASHVDHYDKEQYVGPALATLTKFYRTNLAGREQAVAA